MRWVLIDPNRDVATQLPGWWPTDLVGGGFEVWENPAWIGDAVGQLADGTEIGFDLDRRSSTELVVAVTDPSPMRVIVHSQIAPGWTVRVDGQSADIVDADGFFLGRRRPRWYPHGGVFLQAEVARYRRSSFPVVGMAAIVGLVVADGLRRSKLKAGQ